MKAVLISVILSVSIGAGVSGQTPQGKTPQTKTAPAKVTLPAAVEAAFKGKYPNATIKNVLKETENGKTVYEIESVDAGRRRDLNYYADGSLILYEEELTEADVPAAVLNAIKARYPKATITTRERLYVVKDNSANYEFVVKGVSGVTEIILTPEGQWVSPKAK